MKKCTIFLKSLLVICLVCMSIGCTMVSASDLGLANSKIVELGSFGSNGENISSSNRARTKNIYKTSEQAFKFESSKAVCPMILTSLTENLISFFQTPVSIGSPTTNRFFLRFSISSMMAAHLPFRFRIFKKHRFIVF